MQEPSAPDIQFYHNLYPKVVVPEFDMNNYRINRIMNHYEFLDKERKTRSNLKKKYTKLSNACLGTECALIVSELGLVGTSIALPVIIPFSVPLSVGLTTCSIILRSSCELIAKKISKHSEVELLAKAKLNSIEEKFTKAIKDGKITDEEFNDIEQEIKNYDSMKTSLLNEYNKRKTINNDLKLELIDKGKTLGRNEVWESLKNNYKLTS
jgi:hypothetical protein